MKKITCHILLHGLVGVSGNKTQ